MRTLEKFLAHAKKPAVCTVYTICGALYLRGRFESLPSNEDEDLLRMRLFSISKNM